MDVNVKQIKPSDFRCADILQGSDGNQYTVLERDAFNRPDGVDQYATLGLLPEKERIDPSRVDGYVSLG